MYSDAGDIKTIGNNFVKAFKEGKFEESKDYQIEIKELKEGRNSKQNALYNATLREIQRATINSLRITRDELHNQLLQELGILQYDSDGIPKTQLHKPDYNYMQDSEEHLKPTGHIVKTDGGKELKVFYVLEESKNFDTKQFHDLISLLERWLIDNEMTDKIDIRHLKNLVSLEVTNESK